MDTHYQRTRGDIRRPLPDHPFVPDLVSNGFLEIDARKLGLANGVEVNSILAEGAAPLRDRTFDAKRSDKDWLTFATDIGGMPAIRFNGKQMLSNGSTAGGMPNQRSGPRTEVIVARINAYPTAAHQQRIVTGCREEAATDFTTIQPSTTPVGSPPQIAALQWDSGAGGPAGGQHYGYYRPPRPFDWFVGVFVFDGPRSLAKVFAGVEAQALWLPSRYQGVSFGQRQTTTVAGDAANFDMRYKKIFTRAFTRDEVNAQHVKSRADWGVTQ